jgi:hypothetical protein
VDDSDRGMSNCSVVIVFLVENCMRHLVLEPVVDLAFVASGCSSRILTSRSILALVSGLIIRPKCSYTWQQGRNSLM